MNCPRYFYLNTSRLDNESHTEPAFLMVLPKRKSFASKVRFSIQICALSARERTKLDFLKTGRFLNQFSRTFWGSDSPENPKEQDLKFSTLQIRLSELRNPLKTLKNPWPCAFLKFHVIFCRIFFRDSNFVSGEKT